VMAPFAAAMPFFAPHMHGEELADTWWQQLLSATYVMAGVVLVVAMVRIAASQRRSRDSAEQLVREVPQPIG
jgi:hypothetical protein